MHFCFYGIIMYICTMCMTLYGKGIVYKTAKKDITCYKMLFKRDNGEYCTYYRCVPVKFGKRYEEHQDIPITNESRRTGFGYERTSTISKGVLHVFKNRKDAERVAVEDKNMMYYNRDNPVIVKAIIPKGTKYIEGTFDRWSLKHGNDFKPCYGTTSVIYKKPSAIGRWLSGIRMKKIEAKYAKSFE